MRPKRRSKMRNLNARRPWQRRRVHGRFGSLKDAKLAMHQTFLLYSALALSGLTLVTSMDGILLTTIQIHVDDQQLKKGICDKTKLELEDIAYSPICTSTDQFIYMTYNGTTPITGKENITILLTTDTTDGTANFTGVFSTAKSPANELAIDLVTLQRDISATTSAPATTAATTAAPNASTTTIAPVVLKTNEAHLTIAYVHLQYEENSKQSKSNNNSGAVAVAIIEGIALIGILAYLGYKTMVGDKRKQQQTANLYGYDNNSRITVPDTIRMSDIPPPRDPTYAVPPTRTSQPLPPRPVPPQTMTTQELVVPSSSGAGNSTANQRQNGQFADPFASLDSW